MVTAGTLYIIATPIGNLADWSLRAQQTISSCGLLACEDTRRAKILLSHYALNIETTSLHEHNELAKLDFIIDKLKSGLNVGLVSDAGTPLINDPGFKLVLQAKKEGILVSPIPGCCAAIAAISVSGITTDKFCFEGFLPSKKGEKQRYLESLAAEPRALIFYEAPSRIKTSIEQMLEVFGPDRYVCLAREITKLHETIVTLPLVQMLDYVLENDTAEKGEIVLVVAGARLPKENNNLTPIDKKLINILIDKYSVSDAVAITRQVSKASRSEIYNYAISDRS